MKITAVVLGGGSQPGTPAGGKPVASKALLHIGGEPMAARVLRAVAACPGISGIVYVGPPDPVLEPLADLHRPGGSGLAESLASGLEAAKAMQPDYILAVSADLPHLTAGTLERFLQEAPPVEVVYPVIGREVYEARFPGDKRTYARFLEGSFTGGNIFLLKVSTLGRLMPFINRAYEARKNPLKLAALVGPLMLLKLAIGRLGLYELERRVAQVVGMNVRVFVSSDPAIGADVDKPEQLPREVADA